MTLAEFIVYALATWRTSNLLVCEEGPWGLLSRMRYALGVRYDAHSKPMGLNVVASAFTCVWCLSVWVALGLLVLRTLAPSASFWLAGVLALSAVAALLDRFTGG